VQRDHDLERDLLARAKVPDTLVAQVLSRLDRYEAAHGNTGWEKPLDELLVEMQEEAADIAGWAIGAAPQLTETQLHRLVVAVALGAKAWQEVEELRELLATGRG
jgi:hypothetical protein